LGDFTQSIFKFINANLENILNFKNTFNNVKVIELNKNFRSTQSIVRLSNDIINYSPIKKYKEYKPSESVSEVGEKVKFTLYEREGVQIDRIAEEIVALKEDGSPLKEIAVLVRTNVQTATIEEVLTELDIPFEITKSTSFFDRKEIVDILSYARLASETSDDASFRRIYNVPNRFLSKQSLEKLDKFSSEKDIPLFNAAKTTPQNSDWKFKRGIDSLINIVEEIKFQVSTNVNAGRVLKNIVKLTGYKDFINNAFTNESQVDERIEAVEKICEMASKFPTINAFLAHILKIKEKQNKSKGGDAVQIITMHSAKGLEWDNVFVIDCDSELMPHQMNDDVEEERRLFYVACSRPRKRLYISWLLYVGSERLKEGQFIRELLGEDRINEMKKEIFRGSKESVCFY
ncbi:ATP-dependent helicase, partial [Bacillus pumilus]|uniref:ATP-dependent helicase n=1 Tax=Bacillus pumilus TaxID=1408 RepID=UPI0011A71D3B